MTLSPEGQRLVEDVAHRHGFSVDAVTQMLQAVARGGGNQAQFNHFEFGGMGQWSQGGMIMIGDMFNNGLKARVDSLCNELAGAVGNSRLMDAPTGSWQQQGQSGGATPGFQSQSQSGSSGGGFSSSFGSGMGDVSLFVGGGAGGGSNWWPADLGSPSSTGAQNDVRYAWFPATRRLAIDLRGQVTVYDTGDHQIGGVSQQQGGGASLTFTSQYGLVRVADLPVVTAAKVTDNPPPGTPVEEPRRTPPESPPSPVEEPVETPVELPPVEAPTPVNAGTQPEAQAPVATPGGDVFATLEKLADLHARGILSAEEFQAKKKDLLSRL